MSSSCEVGEFFWMHHSRLLVSLAYHSIAVIFSLSCAHRHPNRGSYAVIIESGTIFPSVNRRIDWSSSAVVLLMWYLFAPLSASSPPRHLFEQGCSFKGKTWTLLLVGRCDLNYLFSFFFSSSGKKQKKRDIFLTLCFLCSVLLASPRTSSITVFDFLYLLIYFTLNSWLQFVVFNPSTPHARHDNVKGLQVSPCAPPPPPLRPPSLSPPGCLFFWGICNLGDRQGEVGRGVFCCVSSTQSHCNH